MAALVTALIILGTAVTMLLAMHLIGAFISPKQKRTQELWVSWQAGQVWNLITDVEKTPFLVKSQTVANYLPPSGDGIKRWVENYPGKKGNSIIYKVAIEKPPKHLRWVIEDQGKLGFGGIWDIQLEPEKGGTIIKVHQTSVIYKPLIRFLSVFYNRSAKIKTYLSGLNEYMSQQPVKNTP